MSSNKKARKEVEKAYGEGCMFERASIEKRLNQIKGIEKYEDYKKSLNYKESTRKKLESNLTYHHLIHKEDDGPTTVENGGNLHELPHRYLHNLPRDQEEIANEMIRQYKYNIDAGVIVPTPEGDLMGESKVKPFVPYPIEIPDEVTPKEKTAHKKFVDQYKVQSNETSVQKRRRERRKAKQADKEVLKEINNYAR